jgi:hypothetical protein
VVAGLIKSASCQLIIRVLRRQAQIWARVTRNKTVRAVRPKADNIWQVGPGCYMSNLGVNEFVLKRVFPLNFHLAIKKIDQVL